MNGVSSAAAAAAKLLYRYESGKIGVFKQPKVLKMSNVEVLSYVRQHPEILDAARETIDDYPAAVGVIGDKGVAAAMGYLINQHFEDGVLHDFFSALGSKDGIGEKKPTDPIVSLHKRFVDVTEEKIPNPRKLALLIKAFVMDAANEKVGGKGISISDVEKFPHIEDAASNGQVAA